MDPSRLSVEMIAGARFYVKKLLSSSRLVVVVVVVAAAAAAAAAAAIFDIVLGVFNSKEHYGVGFFEPRGVFDEKARAIVAFHVRFW